jgi:hypothetical protein
MLHMGRSEAAKLGGMTVRGVFGRVVLSPITGSGRSTIHSYEFSVRSFSSSPELRGSLEIST